MAAIGVFHHLSGSRKGRSDSFDRDLITIGRHPENTLQYDPHQDIKCSAFHAEVRREGESFWLVDRNSRNGTFVNGKRITEHQLRSGDVIQFGWGGPEARFEILPKPGDEGQQTIREPEEKQEVQSPAVDWAVSTVVRPVVLPTPKKEEKGVKSPPLLTPDMVETRGIEIHRLSGVRRGSTQKFREGVIRVGRNPEFDLTFDPERDLAVSWIHAQMIYREPHWFIEDLNSRNGTFVNGKRQRYCRLNDGDVVQFGMGGPEIRVRFIRQLTPLPTAELAAQSLETQTMEWSDVSQEPLTTEEKLEPILLRGAEWYIGRDPRCEIVLRHPSVSRFHAVVRRVAQRFEVEDLNSTNGTYLNGKLLKPRYAHPLALNDRIYVGAYVITFYGDRLEPIGQHGNILIEAKGVSCALSSSDSIKCIPNNVSIVIKPRQFVAILGPSGAGKTRLLNVLSGRMCPSSGHVYYNQDDLYLHYDHYRSTIGYVPQRDIVHRQLPVFEALRYTVKLRLPPDISSEDLRDYVEQVIDQTDLTHLKRTRIADLSGGELKRVNLAVELVCKPNVLFLDEATSGLDAGTDLEIMTMFRRLANEGKTVVCITHNVEYVDMCDLVALLYEGELVYYGPPSEMLSYFRINRISEAYNKLRERKAGEWTQRFRESDFYQTYILQPLEARRALREGAGGASYAPSRAARRPRLSLIQFGLREFFTLACRYAHILTRDRRHLLMMLMQAPIIALLVWLAFSFGKAASGAALVAQKGKIAFFMALSAIWFGCSNAAREIVKERDIYKRERAANLSLVPYVFSKLVILAFICLIQCAMALGLFQWITRLGGDVTMQFVVMFATGIAALLMGLALSAAVSTPDRVAVVVPILLILQIVLADAIERLRGLPLWVGRLFVLAYWSFRAMKATIADVPISVGSRTLSLAEVPLPALPGDKLYPAIGRMGNLSTDLLVIGIFAGLYLALTLIFLRLKDEER